MVKEKKKNMKKSILEMEIFLHNFCKIKMFEKIENMMVEKEEKEPRGRKPMLRWIRAWNLDGDPVGVWPNVMVASEETGAKPADIRACLYGRRKTAGGLLWRDA